METKLGSKVRYTTYSPEEKKHAKSALRRNMGAELYANLQLLGLDNMFTVKIEERTRPIRMMGSNIEPTAGAQVYALAHPETVDEEEFSIDVRVEIVRVEPVIYQFSPDYRFEAGKWDYSLRKSSMPEWLKGILRWIWKEND